MKRKLRMGMIGGGPGSFIGNVHRMAVRLDGLAELVCGSFSRDKEKNFQFGKDLFLSEDRVYSTYQEMIKKEKELPEGERMDFVCVVTPNSLHFDPTRLALENDFHVILEKPMTIDLEEAKALERLTRKRNLELCLMHAYTGYPMVKQAKEMVSNGVLGTVRKIYIEYPQGWMTEPLETAGNKQAKWRQDPKIGGLGGSIGDIGTHAFNLAEYVTGQKVTAVCAMLNTVVENRILDDDDAAFLKFDNGATGVLMATQIATGEENGVKIRVYGDKAGLMWKQEDANSLELKYFKKPTQRIRTGGPDNLPLALYNQRVPAGHPEGFIEAFANLYRNFILTVDARLSNKKPQREWMDFPKAEDGIRGVLFIQKSIASSEHNSQWVNL